MPSNLIKKYQQSFLTNSFYLYMSYFADYFLLILFIPFIARTVGASEFGKIGIAQTFGILIILFMEFGSSLMVTRKVARIKDDNKQLKLFIGKITTFKIFLLPIAILITATAFFVVPIFSDNPNYIIIVALGAVFQGISPIWYFQGIEKMRKIAFSKIIFRLIGFILIVLFVRSSTDGWIVLASFSFSSILICLYLYSVIIRKMGLFRIGGLSESINIFVESAPSFFITIIPILYQSISVFILSVYVNPLQLGFYYGASRIHRAFNTLYGPLSQAFFPIISKINEKNKIKSRVLIKNYFLLIFLIGLLFFLINFFFAEKIISIFLGDKFLPASETLKFFSIVLPLTAVSNSLGRQWLMVLNKDYYFATIQLLSSLIAFFSFYYFLPIIGVKSLPVSLIIYELTSIFLVSIFLIKK
tara:strand:- start:524 stop:1768 length:1245 start_codon:yes stop_codon:yes gene_type:complete